MEIALKPWAVGYLTRVREAAQSAGRGVSAKELNEHLTFVIRMGGVRVEILRAQDRNATPLNAPKGHN